MKSCDVMKRSATCVIVYLFVIIARYFCDTLSAVKKNYCKSTLLCLLMFCFAAYNDGRVRNPFTCQSADFYESMPVVIWGSEFEAVHVLRGNDGFRFNCKAE